MNLPQYSDIEKAHRRIESLIHRTPVFTSCSINTLVGSELYFKGENFQKAGAFKFRGACNAVFSLSEKELGRGVVTHSSGNHGAALALAARLRGVAAHVIMPENAPEIKITAVAGYGAQITLCEPTLAARESTLAGVVEQTGAIEIHPYNDFSVISGQGTAVKELIEDYGDFDLVITPVGGGGLLAGTVLSVKQMSPGCKVAAAEPLGADDACRSFKSKMLIPSVNPITIADGLRTSLGEKNFAIILAKVDTIVTVSEEKIVEAMRLIWERMKIVVEPSAAVSLASILENKMDIRGKKIGIILSGGNVDLGRLPF